jgi:hypothetical protein
VGLNSLKSLNLTNVYPNHKKNNKVKSKPLELYELAGKKFNSHLSTFLSGVQRRRFVGGRFGEWSASSGSKSSGRFSVTQAIFNLLLLFSKSSKAAGKRPPTRLEGGSYDQESGQVTNDWKIWRLQKN